MPEAAVAVAARQRILDSAYELFSRRGVRGVGIDEVITNASVAKATLYRHFKSKDELVLAFLQQREELWTRGWVEAEARRRGETPEEQLLAIFDLFHEWFQKDDFEGCSFINVLLEMNDREDPDRQGERRSPDHHSLYHPLVCRGGRPARSRAVRPLLAHPDEGLDRGRGRRRSRCCPARPGDGSPVDRAVPLAPTLSTRENPARQFQ